jgi:hypothetical protein
MLNVKDDLMNAKITDIKDMINHIIVIIQSIHLNDSNPQPKIVMDKMNSLIIKLIVKNNLLHPLLYIN